MLSEFESLREKLLRAGVAPRNVRRYLTELREHLADLIEREGAAGHDARDAAIRARAALGDDENLSRAMLARPGAQSFSARAPWAVFGLFPALSVLAAFPIALTLLLALNWFVMAGQTHHHLFGSPIFNPFIALPGWFHALASFTTATCNYGLGILIAVPFIIVALRQRMGLAWPLVGIVIIAISASLVTAWVDFPHVPAQAHSSGSYIVLVTSVTIPPDRQHPFVLSIFIVRLLLTLLPAAALYLAVRRRLRNPALS